MFFKHTKVKFNNFFDKVPLLRFAKQQLYLLNSKLSPPMFFFFELFYLLSPCTMLCTLHRPSHTNFYPLLNFSLPLHNFGNILIHYVRHDILRIALVQFIYCQCASAVSLTTTVLSYSSIGVISQRQEDTFPRQCLL